MRDNTFAESASECKDLHFTSPEALNPDLGSGFRGYHWNSRAMSAFRRGDGVGSMQGAYWMARSRRRFASAWWTISPSASTMALLLRQAPRCVRPLRTRASFARNAWLSTSADRLAELAAIAAEKDNVQGPSAAKEVSSRALRRVLLFGHRAACQRL